MFKPLPDLLDDLLAIQNGIKWIDADGREPVKATSETFWKHVTQCELFVLDELATREKVSDFHYTAVKRVLDRREGKPLVVLSNATLAAVESIYDDRIASRLASGTVLNLDGEDRRLKP